jgi:hypothetical protein
MRRFSMLLWSAVMLSCGSSPSSSPLAYCAELAARFCDQQIACSKIAASHRKDCVESLRTNLCGVRSNESNRALVKLNEKLTTKCLADIKSTGCTRDASYLGNACFAAVEPAAATGSKCETDSHCRSLSDRCIGVGCDRTCQTAGAAGQPCRPGAAGVGTCNSGLTCDADGKCSQGGVTGVDCSTALPCNGDNFCDMAADKCVALPPVGQPCRFGFPQCAEAGYCGGASCTARVGSGGTCTSSNQCVVGLSCRTGTCQPQAAEGAGCMQTSDCVAGLACDAVTLTCSKAKRAFFEEACTSTSTCYGGLSCRNVKPARNGTAGTAGVCGIGVAGDSCFSSSGCPPATFCQLPATLGDPGVCTSSSSAATCMADDDCPESEACHRTDRKCATRISIGGNCAQVACGENSTCTRRGAALICVELADLNGTCSNDMVQAIGCRQPLICARSTCISAGRKGEACLGSATMGSCFAGSCLDGICQDQRPDGATCKADSDCVSAACERGICVQQCR